MALEFLSEKLREGLPWRGGAERRHPRAELSQRLLRRRRFPQRVLLAGGQAAEVQRQIVQVLGARANAPGEVPPAQAARVGKDAAQPLHRSRAGQRAQQRVEALRRDGAFGPHFTAGRLVIEVQTAPPIGSAPHHRPEFAAQKEGGRDSGAGVDAHRAQTQWKAWRDLAQPVDVQRQRPTGVQPHRAAAALDPDRAIRGQLGGRNVDERSGREPGRSPKRDAAAVAESMGTAPRLIDQPAGHCGELERTKCMRGHRDSPGLLIGLVFLGKTATFNLTHGTKKTARFRT